VIEKQEEHEDSTSAACGKLVVAETLRSTANPPVAVGKKSKEDKGEHISLFWRVFGGTIISISSLIVITLYNNISTSISDIRSDLSKERDARADLVKKDDFNTRSTGIYDRIRSLDAMKPEMEGLRERVTANSGAMDGLKKDTGATVDALKKDVTATVEGLKKDMAAATDMVKKDESQLEIMKDRLSIVESYKKDVAAIDVLKDKIATAIADLKGIHDEVAKLQQAAERSRSTELERKASGDLQLKQVEESLKEMQKALQDCREKLARLEGAQPGSTTKPIVETGKP
jgi:chromosome segregation ATPase